MYVENNNSSRVCDSGITSIGWNFRTERQLFLAGMDVPGRLQTERDFFDVGVISIGSSTDIDSTGV